MRDPSHAIFEPSLSCSTSWRLRLPLVGGPEAIAYPADFFAETVDNSKVDLDTFLVEELRGLNATRVVLQGDPAATIIQYAHAERFDLIVMPTHGYGTFRRFCWDR